MKYVFIVNPIAGNDDKAKIFSRIKSTFRQLDHEMIIEETHKPGDAKKISAMYAEKYGKNCVIVSCGGDGTVHEIANGIAHTDSALMILPLGTGNDFAKKVYDTKDINVENVIKSFGFYNGKIRYDVKPIDLIDYNGEKCINVMSFGLDTKVETIGRKIASKVPFLGHQSYNIAVVPVLFESLHFNISLDLVCCDENGVEHTYKESNRDYTLFAICNASYYGGGFCPAPNAKLDDGILNYIMLDGINLPKAIPLLPKYSKGVLQNYGYDYVHYGYIKSGRIYMEDGSALMGNCDGENFDYSEVNFKVDPKAINLCFIKE